MNTINLGKPADVRKETRQVVLTVSPASDSTVRPQAYRKSHPSAIAIAIGKRHPCPASSTPATEDAILEPLDGAEPSAGAAAGAGAGVSWTTGAANSAPGVSRRGAIGAE